ncbi:PP2C family protein-serine/threonine phosphatase [Mycoplasmopsis opalescens]|uniref:PP2C family protein-serine/threonine phosphatase n=1 Tax=Mycoplasmopsis opalescens TaxID=114886 RepID=UPI0004A6FBB5|nr:PP2C family serine/threonine-protein phosphatase [Mycoplasmopsis opalescens]
MVFGYKSDIGRRRLENQDAVKVFKNNYRMLLILCDGMGGHYGGSLASNIAINVIGQSFMLELPNENESVEAFTAWFKHSTDKARNEMLKIASNDEAKLDMGTTVTAAYVDLKNQRLFVYNIGDSRTYVLTKSSVLRQISTDHNYMNMLIEQGLKPKDAAKVHQAHSLTSALGPNKRTKIEASDLSDNFHKIRKIIVTSDGVHSFLSELALENLLILDEEPNKLCEKIITMALDNNSTDNASIGIIDLEA